MDFHYINTNDGYNEKDTYKTWLNLGYAFTNGQQRYGAKLGTLQPGDLVFMYVSGKGIKAVGMVIKEWDGIEYRQPIISSSTANNEFRIQVNWFIVPPDDFVPSSKVKEIMGYDFVQTCARINKRGAAEKLLRHMLQMLE